MINISLLGAGYWGEKVAAELKNIKEVGNIEIIDIKNGKDIKDIQYDNVIIATPALDHYEQSINLLKQRKNLYLEKPLASTEHECLEIKKVINNQILMVGHIFLYNDRLKKIKEIIESGKIGKIKYIESNPVFTFAVFFLFVARPTFNSLVTDFSNERNFVKISFIPAFNCVNS